MKIRGKAFNIMLGPGVCGECLSAHSPDTPHDKESLFYQCVFHTKHGRWPTWADAGAHCVSNSKNEEFVSGTEDQ